MMALLSGMLTKKQVENLGAGRHGDDNGLYLADKSVVAAKALMFTCLTGARTGEVLGMRWEELELDARIWTCPAVRMKTGEDHRVPLTDACFP
jgi:integrase